MDEYSTPIEQIRPDMNTNNQQNQPVVNYSDMLQSMETQQQDNSQIQQQEFPPHPIVQSKIPHNANMNMNYVQQKQQPSNTEDNNNMSQIQKDMMYILIPSILLYSNQVQAQILKVLPSLFKEEKPTILGNVVNGLIISIIFIGMKNMKIDFS